MSLLEVYSTELHNIVVHGTLQFDPRARYSSLEVLQCVVDEVELGVASDMECEPLIGPDNPPPTYDENGITIKNEVSSDFQEMGKMDLCQVQPMPCNQPMEQVPCY